jgi:hypothetical protein
MEYTAKRQRGMACQGQLPYKDWREYLHIVLQCDAKRFFDSIGQATLWEKTKPKHKASSGETREGGTKMRYEFQYTGGAQRIENANYKFHVFVVDNEANEHHLYGALKNGLIEKMTVLPHGYLSATPVLKVFTATAGFGVPKEFFSYFIRLTPTASKVISIKPLGFKNIESLNWMFSAKGVFLKKDEVRRFFGADSDTWKYYQRQSFLSRHRLQELVQVVEASSIGEAVNKTKEKEKEEIRMLRFD